MNLSECSPRIHIKNNWSDAKLAGICNGSGIYSDPYVIDDLIINGQNDGIGIHIEQSKNKYFRIENCTIYNCSSGILLKETNNGTLILNNCSFNNDGIVLDGWGTFCYNNTILNNTVNNNLQDGIVLEGGFPHNKNNTITHNTINNNQNGINISGNNNTISGNLMNNNEQYGIYFDWGFGNIINGNLMNGCGFFCYDSNDILSLNKIDKTNLVNNKHLYIYVNKTGLDSNDFINGGQIILFNCNDSLISDIDLSNGSVGISLSNSFYNTISNINASYNCDYGMNLENSNNNQIIDSNINNNYIGIRISGCNYTNIEGNIISFNSYIGIKFFGYYSTFKKNNLTNNLYSALHTFGINNSTITENSIKGSQFGIYLAIGENNLFYRNFFENNLLHAQDNGINNKWDNEKLGNYWDDYIGVDANNDGIGDTPYIIFGMSESQDNFPILDITKPELTINMPKNGDIYGFLAPKFNLEINDEHLDKSWYLINGGKDIFFWENETIDKFEWNILPDGLITIMFNVNDTCGNIAYAEINVLKDATPPSIIIISPDSNEIFETEAPTFEISINESNLDTVWYSLNGGTNITFTGLTGTIYQALWNVLPEGNVTIRFYACDSAGNIGFAKIIIIKKTLQEPLPLGIPGYNIFIIIGLISIISVILWKKKF